MKYMYLVTASLTYAPFTGKYDKIFYNKNNAYNYYIHLRNEYSKISKIEENTDNIYGDINKENCKLVTTLYRDGGELAKIRLIALEVGD